MNKEKLILPIAIVVGCFIIGVFLYSIQANKQAGIDRKFEAEQLEKTRNSLYLSNCLADAESEYWSYMELNGTKNEDTGVVNALTRYWDTADKNKQNAINNCYKQYK
jgi:hypothetical protein